MDFFHGHSYYYCHVRIFHQLLVLFWGSIPSDDGSSTIADLIPDTKYNPEERYLRQEKIGQVHDIVNSLPENEKKVICNRFNFAYEQHVPTLRELSSELGVSAETVRQMEMRAVRKIRELAATMRMEELITA